MTRPRRESQQAAESRYETSGKRPARHQVKATLDDDQFAQLQRSRRPGESNAAALVRLAGLATTGNAKKNKNLPAPSKQRQQFDMQ